MSKVITLAGNPNSGKTTIFNNLTGATQYVGNWPGVTVEKKEGKLRGDKQVSVVDLPGIYSLSPYTPEEVVSRDFLLSGEAGSILNLVDSTNIERNLFLTTQLLELGLPMVLALNMTDLLQKNGDKINVKKLSESIGCAVVEISALRGKGTMEAAKLTAQLADAGTAPKYITFSESLEAALAGIAGKIAEKVSEKRLRWYSIKLFERDELVQKELSLSPALIAEIEELIKPLEAEMDDDAEGIVTSERYAQITGIIAACVTKKPRTMTRSDKIDRIVTNRWLALPIFALVMTAVYYIAIMTIGDTVTGWTNDVFVGEWIMPAATSFLEGIAAPEWLIGLIVDGAIAGVGGVLGFLPQMAILYIMLSFLEGIGYMARVAFIMDRIFRKFGLSGKSFIPMLISSGCAVPGIMATKTIENEKDRRMTSMTTSFIPCGAKLPIIALIGGALLNDGWWVSPVVYFAGVGSVIISGIILKKTKLFAGDPAPFVMELPQYHLPTFKTVFMQVWERVASFFVKAGTIIFLSSIAMWLLLSLGFTDGSFGLVDDINNSLMASLGSAIAVLFAPLGFGNWEAVVGVIAGFVAKENLVATMAIVANLSAEATDAILDDTSALWGHLQTLIPNMAAGLSFLLFNMVNPPCFAAMGAMRKQMNSGKWTAFAICYQVVYAYCISLMVYQFGSLFLGGSFGAGTVAAFIVLIGFIFLLFRPTPKISK